MLLFPSLKVVPPMRLRAPGEGRRVHRPVSGRAANAGTATAAAAVTAAGRISATGGKIPENRNLDRILLTRSDLDSPDFIC